MSEQIGFGIRSRRGTGGNGANQLVVRLTSGVEDFYQTDSASYYAASHNAIHDNRVYLRKPQFTYGWDWCKPVPQTIVEEEKEGPSAAR